MAERDMLYKAKFQDDVTPAVTAMQSRIEAANAGLSSGFRSATESASAFTAGVRSLAEAQNALHNAAQNSITDLKAQKMAMQDVGYRQAQAEIKALQAELNPAPVKNMSQAWQEMASKYFLVSQAAGVLGRGIMAVVDASKEYDSVRTRLTATEGSALVADKDLRNLQELAKLPGLGFGEASRAMAALRSLHVSAKDTFALIEGISRGNASMGGGAEAFGRVMYQIQQSIGSTKVTMEDLKPVMEAIPNIGSMIVEKFGSIDSEAINKKLASMGKTSKDFWMDIADMASKLPPAGDTIANNIDNIGDAWTRLKASFGNPEQIKALTGALAGFLDKFAEFREKGSAEAALRLRAEASLGMAKGSVPGRLFNRLFHGEEVEERMAKMRELDDFNAKMDAEAKAKEDKRLADKIAADKKREDDKIAADKVRADNAKEMTAHNLASQQNVETNFDGSVTLRSGIEYDEGVDPEHLRNREKAENKRGQREQQELNERQKLEANAQKAKLDWVGALAAEKKRAHDEEMRQLNERVETVRSFAAAEVSQALQGKLTIKGLEQDLTGFLADQFAQRATKWIAEEIVKASAATAIQTGQTAASIAQAAATSAAWATPSLEISMATFGSSAAAGSAAWFNALAAGQMVGGLPMRARGGMLFGEGLLGEQGMERGTPLVPMQITNNTYTTHSSTSGPKHFHFHGADLKVIRRMIRNADVDGEDTSR